jgi:hypothetical protein
MSSYREVIDVGLLLFQAAAQDLVKPYGLSQVDTYTHSTSGLPARYFCRYQLPGDDTEYESPAGRNCAEAIVHLRAALAQHLGPPLGGQ